MSIRRHPSEFGFRKAMVFNVSKDGHTDETESSPFADTTDVVYVFTDHRDVVFRAGETSRKLRKRVGDYTRVMNPDRKVKPHERAFGHRMLKITEDRPFVVWAKQPVTVELELVLGFKRSVSARHAEEIYWKHYYEPKLR